MKDDPSFLFLVPYGNQLNIMPCCVRPDHDVLRRIRTMAYVLFIRISPCMQNVLLA